MTWPWAAGFEAMLTLDKNMEFEQNLAMLPIAVVVLDSPSNALKDLVPFIPSIQSLLGRPIERLLFRIGTDGSVTRVGAPRT